MSLYLELKINDDTIGQVIVSRIRTADDARTPHTYAWHVCGTPGSDIGCVEGKILHHERFGAFRLAASVLTAYEARTRRALRRKPSANHQ